MNEECITARWEKEKPIYQKWGERVVALIKKRLSDFVVIPEADFLKFCDFRIKTTESLIKKALHSGKNYKNPYEDITDKVGVRFVVLMKHQGEDIGKIIASYAGAEWNMTRDRGSDDDWQNNPRAFEYQSNHFVVRSAIAIEENGLRIPEGIPCEVQVRTLLQHSICEMEHYYIYKRRNSSSEMKRLAAKCWALADVLDDTYMDVIDEAESLKKPAATAYVTLNKLYEKHVNLPVASDKIDRAILGEFDANNFQNMDTRLDSLVKKHDTIIGYIKERRERYPVFRHPVILFAYLMADSHPEIIKSSWPGTDAPLIKVFADLGKSYDATI